jgi:hypothetical protein
MYLTISVSSGDLVFFKCVNNEMKNIKSAILCYIAVNWIFGWKEFIFQFSDCRINAVYIIWNVALTAKKGYGPILQEINM